MKNKFLFLFLSALVSFSLQVQVTDTTKHTDIILKRSLCLLTGYSLGTYSYADIGLGKLSSATTGHHPFSSVSFISTEIKPGDKFIAGPKIGVWTTGS